MDRTKPDAPNTSEDATQSQPVAHDTQAGAGPPPGLVAHPQALGGYRIVRLLGQGGMGAVYHARDDQLDRDLAIKTMRPDVAAQPGAVERFLREARAAAKVEHDNVIPILHVGQDTGTPYIAMPLLKGLPLDKWLRGDVVAPLGVVLKVGRETADGLACAHAKGLIHRDIKPANIWIEGDPQATDLNLQFRRVKILDFGLARPATDDTHLTNSGAVLGTPAYMSPEQGRALPVDFRTDLWSLGVVLYRMTTGGMPFRGASTMATLMSLGIDTPPAPHTLNRDVPPALSDLIMRLLSKEREGRPASAAHVAAELRAIGRQAAEDARRSADAALSQSQPLPVAPESNPFADIDAPAPTEPEDAEERTELAPAPPAAPKRGRGRWLAVGGALVLAVGAVAAAVAFGGKKPPPAPDPSETTKAEPAKPQPGPSVAPKPQPKDADRKAAEWVLSVGGRVAVVGAGTPELAAKALVSDASRAVLTDATGRHESDVLPTGPFVLAAVRAGGRQNATIDADLAVFADCRHVAQVHLGGAPLTGAGLKHFKGCTKLRDLSLHDTPVESARLEHLRDFTDLEALDLGSCVKVNDDGLRHLAGLTKLAYLSLHDSKTTDTGLAHLKGMNKLRTLTISGTGVTNVGLIHLKGMSELQTLTLTRTAVGDAGLEHLAGLTNLAELFLHETNVTADGVKRLAKAIPGCKITSHHGVIGPTAPGDGRTAAEWALSVGGYVHIKTGGGEQHVSKRDQLPQGPVVLTQVSATGAQVTDAGLANLKGVTGLTSVHLNGAKITNAGLAHLTASKGLEKLHLTGVAGVTDAGLEHLKGLTELTLLDLGGTKVTGVGLAKLGGAKKLTHLDLEGCKVLRNADLAAVAAFPELRWLNLRLNPISDAGLTHLTGLTELVELHLSDTQVRGPGLSQLKGLPKLAILDVSNGEFADAGVEHLAALRALVDVNLSGTRVTGTHFDRLRELPALHRVALSNTKLTDAAVAHLAAIPRLKNLVLSKSGATDAGLKHLAGAKGLNHLYVDDTPVTDAGLEHLTGLAALESLGLKGTRATADGVAKLATALPKCKIMSDHGAAPKK